MATDWSALIAQKKEADNIPVAENAPSVKSGTDWSGLIAKRKAEDIAGTQGAEQPPVDQPVDEPIVAEDSVTPEMGLTRTGENEYTEVEAIESIPMVEALRQGLTNLPSSAKKQVSSIIDAIKNPGQTWEGLKTLSKDIYKNQMEVALKDMGFDTTKIKFEEGSLLENIEQTQALDAVVDDLEKTYGSYDRFKQTIAKDPARVVMDMGAIVAPVAKGTQAVAAAADLPAVAKVASAISKTASLADPITAAAAGTKQAISTTSKLTGQAFRSLTPTGLYKSATKMSTKLSEADRNYLVNFAMDNEIMPTLEGLDKIDNSIFNIDTKISEMIDNADLSGKAMPIKELFKDFENLKSERMLSTKPLEGVRAINRIKNNMLEANKKINKDSFTPKEAQKLKQTIYKDLKGAYESMKSSPANVKAQKAVARSAKEYLEGLLPEIKQLNKNDGDLINLRKALEGPASRISNRDITSLGAPAKIGTGALLGASGGTKLAAAGATVGAILAIIDDPVVKSKLAIVLNKLQKKGVNINENRAIARLIAAEAATTADTIEENQ